MSEVANKMNQDKPIHITHIASGDLWAGAEVQLFTLCNALNKQKNIKISVILLNHGMLESKLREQDIHVEVYDETKQNSFHLFLIIHKRLKALKPDVVHTHRFKENILGGFSAFLSGNTPSIRTAHGASEHNIGILQLQKKILFFLDWFSARFIQKKIVAVSQDLKLILSEHLPANKIEVVENGVDIEALEPLRKTPRVSMNQEVFKVGIVGRLVSVKRVDLLINVAKLFRDKNPEQKVKYHIYGDGPLLNELKALAKSLKVVDIVKFEGHCHDIHEQIASLDALLITSDHEGLPMTLLEAMALGVPVVTHSVGGITQVCQNGEHCIMVSSQNSEEYVRALSSCLDEVNTNKTKAKLARSYVVQNYSANANAKALLSIYKSVLC